MKNAFSITVFWCSLWVNGAAILVPRACRFFWVRGGWWSGTRQKPQFPFSLLVEYFLYFHKERITAV